MAAFDDKIQNEWVGVRFFCTIDGIGKIFLDGPGLIGPGGTLGGDDAWGAPTSKGFAYELMPYSLDMSAGLRDIGQEILRRSGATSPGAITIRLIDDRLDTLLDLFARDKSNGNRATIDADLAHDTTGAGSVIECDDLTGWAASGTAFIGRECIKYPLINGADLGNSGNKCTRDVYSVGSSDISYTMNANSNAAPRVISDFPTTWHHRCVRLFAVLVDRDGFTLSDSGTNWFTATYNREIFRGVIQGNPEPEDSLTSWTIRLRTIDALLHSNVGKEPTEAELVRVAGNWAANEQGKNIGPLGSQSPILGGWFITDSTTTFDITITAATDQYYLEQSGDGAKAVFKYSKTIAAAGTFLRSSDVAKMFSVTIRDEIAALNYTHGGSTYTPFQDITVNFNHKAVNATSESLGLADITGSAFQIHLAMPYAGGSGGLTGSQTLKVVLHAGVQSSICKLWGFAPGDQLWHGGDASSGDWWAFFNGESPCRTIAYIGPTDGTIPFWQSSSQGQTNDTPPSSGYAVIGEEVLYYSGISDMDATQEGMYALTGCKRGQLGTAPQQHTPEVDEEGAPAGDRVVIKFVQAFSEVSIFDAIRQLAVSTGSGHHGDFDILGREVGPAIPPEHFDNPAFEALKNGAGLEPWEHKVSYWFAGPKKLSELIAKWLQPLNMFVTARTGDSGQYQITVEQVLPPLQSEAYHSIQAANISVDNFGTWRTGADMIVNELSVKWLFDVVDGKVADHNIVARDLDSIADYGTKGRMTWELQGYQWGYTTAIKRVYRWARRIFRSYGRPYDLLDIEVDRTGWSMRPGQTVVVTTPGIPNSQGGRGLEYRAATVLSAQHTYHNPDGAPGSRITVALEAVERQSSYVPSARTAAYDAGNSYLYTSLNEFTEEGNSADGEHFQVGDKIRIFNEGTAETVDDRTIVAIEHLNSAPIGSRITLNSALSAVTWNTNTTVVTSSPYDVVTEEQGQHVYVANLSDASLDTTPFKYV